MMQKNRPFRWIALFAACLFAVSSPLAQAQARKNFNVCWTIYAGWVPWGYIDTSGIIGKWGKKYGINIRVTQINDVGEALNQYTAGKFDACTMTNMDALIVPVAGGVDTTALIAGSYSDGGDGVVVKGKGKTLKDLKGMNVYLPELTVSHYLLARGLETVGLRERDIKVVNTSDADLVAAYATGNVRAVVAWNPQLMALKSRPDTMEIFSSRQIPGEIIDIMVANTRVLKDNPALGKALTGAWYETMALMKAGNVDALEAMAKSSGTNLAGYRAQLENTRLFHNPQDNLAFITSPDLVKTMRRVAQFSFEKGLLGEGAKNAEAIGMAFPGGVVLGDKKRILFRVDDTFVRMAIRGAL
ncbi:MAG: putative urea ABC transporter substrate-binding protein [Zoogloeaceae bacterium]|jgi:NitT/TauT family transport system substrate-binding protein|nr:putative urea ABC transporter substrate-binding protein [Zoogloeaceae bacterium]